jgi:S1-C subfamily serine protease
MEEFQVVVLEVLAGGQAGEIGLRKGDVVTRYAGQKIISLGRLNQFVATSSGADTELEIRRDGKPLTFKVGQGRLGARFEEKAAAAASATTSRTSPAK